MLRDKTLNALLDNDEDKLQSRDRDGRRNKIDDDRLRAAVMTTREQITKVFEGGIKVSTRLRIH